jgi:hypothetical protein
MSEGCSSNRNLRTRQGPSWSLLLLFLDTRINPLLIARSGFIKFTRIVIKRVLGSYSKTEVHDGAMQTSPTRFSRYHEQTQQCKCNIASSHWSTKESGVEKFSHPHL